MAHAKQISNPLTTDHVGRRVLFMGRLPGRIYDYDPCSQMWLIKLDTTAANVWVWAFSDQFEFVGV